MAKIMISEKKYNYGNLLYIQMALSELLKGANCLVNYKIDKNRNNLIIECKDQYADIMQVELADKIAEVIAIKYKYDFLVENVKVAGLNSIEKEILFASLIAADLEDDKRYAFDRLKGYSQTAIDGFYNFKLNLLKKKWQEVITYIPTCFLSAQLRDFISFLIENKQRKVYIDGGNVYDNHYRRLKRTTLLGGEKVKIIREVLLSNCGKVELSGSIPADDEYYLREFYNDKIIFLQGND